MRDLAECLLPGPGYDAPSMDRKADAHLAQRLMERDETALREVIDRYGGAVYGLARRVIAEPTLAEEVAQDAFLALWRRPGAYDSERGSLQSFLLGVARNKAIDLVRREEARKRAREALAAEFEATASVQVHGSGIEERDEVRGALQQLSSVQREAIVLAYFGGRTYREVAIELDIPEGTAKTRLRDGIIRLRELMGASRGME
jgi:RNA polymerase sigma-70 factor (ECF subfamily)